MAVYARLARKSARQWGEASRQSAKHSGTHRAPTGYNSKHMGVEGFVPLEPLSLCARTDAQLVVPCEASVAKTFKVFGFRVCEASVAKTFRV